MQPLAVWEIYFSGASSRWLIKRHPEVSSSIYSKLDTEEIGFCGSNEQVSVFPASVTVAKIQTPIPE